MINVYIYGRSTPQKRGRMRRCVVAVKGDVANVREVNGSKGTALAAEWNALFDAVDYIEQELPSSGVILSDNESLIKAVNGIGKIRSNVVKSLKQQYDELAFKSSKYPLVYIPSTANLARTFVTIGLCQEFEQALLAKERVTTVRVERR